MHQPILFLANGSPLNCVTNNLYTQKIKNIFPQLPQKPKAILYISPNWITMGHTSIQNHIGTHSLDKLTGINHKSLDDFSYSASLDLQTFDFVQKTLSHLNLQPESKELDYGVWTTLPHLSPLEDIPVLNISVDYNLTPQEQFEFGAKLSILSKENILIVATGNILHHQMMSSGLILHLNPIHNWMILLNKALTQAILESNYTTLFNYKDLPFASLGINTPHHITPLFYSLGAASALLAKPSFIYEGFERGTIDMTSIIFQ